MMTEKIFIVILGLLGHNRMGKTCAPKMFGFLRHPNLHAKKIEDWTMRKKMHQENTVKSC